MTPIPAVAQAILIEIGGVIADDHLPAAAADWGARLGISQRAFLAAVFGRNDDQVLTGRVSEDTWWEVVRAGSRSGLACSPG